MKKKIIALGLVAAMACSPLAVFGDVKDTAPASGNGSGSGSVEGIVDLDVFSVDLPTSSGSTTFNFKLDPQELIFNTAGSQHNNIKPTQGTTVIFENDTDGDSTVDALTNTSDKITVKNLGTVKVDVTVTATVTTDLSMSADNTFADDASLYLALVNGDASVTDAVDVSTKKAELKATIDGVAASNFEYGYDTSNNKYTYALKSTFDQKTAPSYSFALTGAANTEADWVGDETATVAVVWTLDKHVDVVATAPSIASSTFTYSAASGARIAVNLGSDNLAATGVAKVEWANTASDTFSAIAGYESVNFDASTNEIVLPSGLFPGCAAGGTRAIKVTFNDTASTSVVLTMTKAN